MGLMDLLGKGGLSEKKIAKISKLACNPYAQPDVRMREMQKLLSEGSPASLRGVLKRFSVNASGNIADEDEKRYLEDAITNVGEDALQPLRNYIKSEQQLTYALRTYQNIAGPQESVRYFLEILNYHGPEDYRSLDAKLQLVWQLAENLRDPRVIPGLLPFLDDHSDDVRWAVMDLIERSADEGLLEGEVFEQARAAVGQLVLDELVSQRIMQRAAVLLCGREWQIPTDAEALASALDEQYFLDKKRYVRKRVKRG